MAISSDKGRHRRGRWWRRGSYLFSRRTEAPPEAERSFWASRVRRSRDAGRPGADDPDREPRDEPGRTRRPDKGRPEVGRPEVGRSEKDRLEKDRARSRDRAWGRAWDQAWEKDRPRRWEGRERLSAAVVEEPRYTWYDFELQDAVPRARPNRPDLPPMGDGLSHCGKLERILHRQWDSRLGPPPPEVVRAVESLARLPDRLKEKLAAGLEGIYVGPGGVPDLDDMGYLRGAPLPSGRATWDICAGAYGERKIVVGDRPSPTPDVMMHEVGHAIDDIDSAFGEWVSDSPEFAALFRRVEPLLVSSFHRQGGGLGRKEFFADAFAAIAARQRPALVDMLGGNTRMALDVMLFFNRRYGI
ncbi:hypothetical protein OUY22_07005 [Nonomuraea sp. MCN248]|uniref:Lysine-specific metallo-endopeptidase domain-containing protein n=1 Tax=Nonomuraea corallina TaxID=2989783 RepID=A0ABT4S7K5_9ACTN|nr:hypothetical protein [Nonomuraea corallina]MDA0633164.1 hypothetical protein [Nonomuraea corallina]